MAAMRINRSSAVTPLTELKKNDTELAKRLKVVASGQTLNSAGDGASNFAISERMRVRIRSLGQDNENVQTGMSMLRVAGGAVQEQINIMRSIKQKVIDANNDSNTDSDRAIIQKEIDQGYQQIEDIATDTTYNGRHLLLGGAYDREVFSWEVKDHAVLVEGSDELNMVPDKYDPLDGQEGPFDVFNEGATTTATIDSLKLGTSSTTTTTSTTSGAKRGFFGAPRRAPAATTSTYLTGAQEGNAGTYTVSFSNYKNAVALDGVGVNIAGYRFVFRKDSSKTYDTYDYVDISSVTSTEDAVKALADVINRDYYPSKIFTAKGSGTNLELTTVMKDSNQNAYSIEGYSTQGTSGSSGTPYAALPGAGPTGYFSSTTYLSGGTDQSGQKGDVDSPFHEATKASLTVKMPGLKAGTGITLTGSVQIQFIAGNSGFKVIDTNGGITTYTVGVDASSSTNTGWMDVSIGNKTMTFTSNWAGSSYNSYSVSDGASGHKAGVNGGSGAVAAVKKYNGTVTNHNTGKNGTNATYTFDLSSITDTPDSAALEDVIHDMRGKNIAYTYKDFYGTGSNDYSMREADFEFVDSADPRSLANTARIGTAVDLNGLRSQVANGTTVREAVRQLLLKTYSSYPVTQDASGNIVLTSHNIGAPANEEHLDVQQRTLISYDLDYGTYLKDNNMSPQDLVGKGFRWYCATDPGQWFNVLFTDGSEEDEDRPESGTATQDIKTMSVDVSNVKDASELVNAIYDQTMPYLTGSNRNYNHHYSVAADSKNGVLTIYDRRSGPLYKRDYPQLQEKGAKIADGVLDNVVKSKKDLLVDDLVIQHTDKANKNIHLRIARTTLDHIFQFRTDAHDISEYNVMTKDMREKLLGYQKDATHKAKQGILDRGIEYLTDAEVMIGAQSNHLEHAHDAIVTDEESTTASDSVIRDADMAKEMTNYMRANILTQTASAMTAQANQSSKNVLELL